MPQFIVITGCEGPHRTSLLILLYISHENNLIHDQFALL